MEWANRRRYKRYAPKELTFAVLHEACFRSGPVVSVSKGGLAFEYLPTGDFHESSVQEASPHIDLLAGEAPLYISKIPCEVLYDFGVEDDNGSDGRVERRCCGLKFGELSDEQANGLDAFLQDYVVDKNDGPNV